MIAGIVNSSNEPVVRLDLVGHNGQRYPTELIVDTGFTGFMTAPPALIRALGWQWCGRALAVMADGRDEVCDVYAGTIVCDGHARRVETEAVDANPLVGMALLRGHDLHVRVLPGGAVTIAPVTLQ
jgi:predicted aspartyl protease